ncbi:hypothetical protein ABPG77_000292 [Micractinium sp. CCAP 211/92]
MLRAAESIAYMAVQTTVQGLMPALAEGLAGGATRPGAAAFAAARAFSAAAACGSRYQPTSRGRGDEDNPATSLPHNGATVVLVSGGVESAALLSYWKHWDHGQQLHPLFVDYGQKNARAEEAAQLTMCRRLGLEFNAINASMVAHQLNMSVVGRRYHDPLPHRNLLLLSLAASFAADTGASNVAICLNRDDIGGYSTATMPFLRHTEGLFQTLEPSLTLLMPLLGLQKHQVLVLGDQVQAPWHLTWSCAEWGKTPCGTCPPCVARQEAFERAELKDPLVERPLPHQP